LFLGSAGLPAARPAPPCGVAIAKGGIAQRFHPLDHWRLQDERDDPHGLTAPGTLQRQTLVDPGQQIGLITNKDNVAVLVTGHGLKDPGAGLAKGSFPFQ